MHWCCRELPADADRVGIFGHSMGGHGALVAGAAQPGAVQVGVRIGADCAPTQCPWGDKAFSAYLGAATRPPGSA